MTQMPTHQDLQLLAANIAETGIAAHDEAIVAIAEVTEQAGLYPGAVAALRDDNAPEVLRSRAFVIIARDWATVLEAATERAAFERSFQALANQADEHHKLRASGDIAALWSSRSKLDALRIETATRRLSSAS